MCVCLCVGEGGGGCWRARQKWDVVGRRGWGVSDSSRCPIFIFFIKENWICALIRHHVNNILLARNLPFDSDVRQWRHPLTSSMVFWKMYLQKKWRNLDFLRLLILSDYIIRHILLASINPALLGLRYNCIACGLYRTLERMVNLNVT